MRHSDQSSSKASASRCALLTTSWWRQCSVTPPMPPRLFACIRKYLQVPNAQYGTQEERKVSRMWLTDPHCQQVVLTDWLSNSSTTTSHQLARLLPLVWYG